MSMSPEYRDVKRAAFNAAGVTAAVVEGDLPKKDLTRFRLVPFADIKLSTTALYLVKKLIPKQGLIIVWGPPKCGKSFFTFDIAMHVARGLEYRGRRVAQGAVAYIACEGEHGFNARVEAYRRVAGDDIDPATPFFLLPTRLDLAHDHPELISDITRQLGGVPCVLVVVDTLNRSLSGSESSDEDMAAYIKAADAIREAFRCAVVVIHHCGIDDKRPRGHTSLAGAADAQIAVRQNAGGTISATIEFMKDGEAGAEIVSTLKVVELDIDEDGEPVTSCVIEAIEGAPELNRKRQVKLTGPAKIGLDQLRNCLVAQGRSIPASDHVPGGVTSVTLTEWRDYLAKAGVINMEASHREQFRRIRVTLQNAGMIGVWDDFVWSVT